MRVVNEKNNNYWHEVEKSLEEHTTSGYKIACIEAEKVFMHLLKEKGYPIDNMGQTLLLFGWKLTDKDAVNKALEKTKLIKESFEYRMSSFEAEDIVEVFKQAICDFSDAKALTWQKKLTIFFENYASFKSSFFKKTLIGILLFFLLIKFLAHTKFGGEVVILFIGISDFIYSWFLLLLLVSVGIFVFVIATLIGLDKNKTRIKSIKDK